MPLELVGNLGVNGYASADLMRDELPALAPLRPEFVSLLIGVNDVVQRVAVSVYARHVATILGALLAHLPATRIVTISVPDYTVTPSGADFGDPARQAAAIAETNATMAGLSADRGIAYVDVLDISRAAATDRSLVAQDGLHPSGAQYRLWVQRIAPVVANLLSDRSGGRAG